MAVKTFYITDTAASSPGWYGIWSESAPASATTLANFVAGKLSVNNFAKCMCAGGTSGNVSSTQATSFISGLTGPTAGTSAAPTALGDSLRTLNTYTGVFAAGNWVFTFALRPPTVSFEGAIRFRLWRSVNASGASATEITSGVQQCSDTGLMNSSTTTYTSSLTLSLGSVTVTNEYLFTQVEWIELTATGGTNSKAGFRVGTESTLVTTDLGSGVAPFMFPRRRTYLRR